MTYHYHPNNTKTKKHRIKRICFVLCGVYLCNPTQAYLFALYTDVLIEPKLLTVISMWKYSS